MNNLETFIQKKDSIKHDLIEGKITQAEFNLAYDELSKKYLGTKPKSHLCFIGEQETRFVTNFYKVYVGGDWCEIHDKSGNCVYAGQTTAKDAEQAYDFAIKQGIVKED